MLSPWQQIQQTGFLENRRVHYLDQVDSTNTHALSLAQNGADSGTVIIADTQNKGRGRLGKVWQSPFATGLYFSIILRPKLPAADLPKITLATGLAVSQAIEKTCCLRTKLKWPNDLLINGKKLAGILCESALNGNDTVVVLGIGINVSTPLKAFPEELQSIATSLLIASGQIFDRGIILKAILAQIDSVIMQLEKNKFAEILDQWRVRDATKDQWLRWLTPAGDIVNGLSLGPNEDGLLMIRDADGLVHQVLSGDISLYKKA